MSKDFDKKNSTINKMVKYTQYLQYLCSIFGYLYINYIEL